MKVLLLAVLLVGAVAAFAQPQQSENFRITKSVLDAGGGLSTSANFRLVSAFGQPSPLGEQASANFVLHAGFLSPALELSPLSPVQALVIQQQGLNAFLSWNAVAGAGLYRIYRSTTPAFVPGPGNLVGSTAGTTFTDSGVISLPALRHYYVITADHGSGPAVAVTKPAPPTQAKAE